MTFSEAYNYVLSLQNLPRKEFMMDAARSGAYMERLQAFLDIVGNPEKQIPHYIHVTGTSGKGSTVTYLHEMLHHAGVVVGSTVSPHPTKITERWKIGNREMMEEEFAILVDELRAALDTFARTTNHDLISGYEFMEALSLLWFVRNDVQWGILEVGLGGRYDTTNIIPHKDACVITNIGLDHMNLLGNTKEQIAYEKAGIIKYGAPVFTSEQSEHMRNIFQEEADLVGSEVFTVGTNCTDLAVSLHGTVGRVDDMPIRTFAIGAHQLVNARLAAAVLSHLGFPAKAVDAGLRAVQTLRFEVVSKDPLVVLDGAHNKDKMQSTVSVVKALQNTFDRIHLVVGCLQDKQVDVMLKKLATLSPTSVAATRNTENFFRKSEDPRTIASAFSESTTEIFFSPKDAFNWAKYQASPRDLILVTGSIYMAGEIRGMFNKT